jgi:iron complex transport system ATP-binding protein
MTRQRLSQLVSVVLTDPLTDSLMTVGELVASGRMPYTGFLGGLSDSDRAIVDAAMERLDVLQLAGRHLSQISDGQRQRALIARAIAQQTPVLMLDEPTAFLDFRSRAQVMQLLRDLAHKEGKSVLCSTHELDLAGRFGDVFWTVDGGGVVVMDKEEFVSVFFKD